MHWVHILRRPLHIEKPDPGGDNIAGTPCIMIHLTPAISYLSLLSFYHGMLVPNFHPQPTVTSIVQGTQWVHSMPSSTYMYPVCITAVQWSYKKIHVRGRRESLAAERRGCLHVCCMWVSRSNTMGRSSSWVQNSFAVVWTFFSLYKAE